MDDDDVAVVDPGHGTSVTRVPSLLTSFVPKRHSVADEMVVFARAGRVTDTGSQHTATS